MNLRETRGLFNVSRQRYNSFLFFFLIIFFLSPIAPNRSLRIRRSTGNKKLGIAFLLFGFFMIMNTPYSTALLQLLRIRVMHLYLLLHRYMISAFF
jgi:hypothetical protein